MGSLSPYNDHFYLIIAEVLRPIEDDPNIIYYGKDRVFYLDRKSEYYISTVENSYTYYSIPRSDLFDFKNDKEYTIVLSSSSNSISANKGIYNEYIFTVRERTAEEISQDSQDKQLSAIGEQTDAIKDQTEAIKEGNETNKGIWESIKSIINFINPLSEDFFVYKLIDLLIDALKSLFVPSDDFFTNWIEDLNTYFGDKFGILYFPLECVIDFLNRIGNISETTGSIISIPTFTLSFMDFSATFFNGFTYDLNSILENNTFKMLHDIYLVFTDIILWLFVVHLASKMIKMVIRRNWRYCF